MHVQIASATPRRSKWWQPWKVTAASSAICSARSAPSASRASVPAAAAEVSSSYGATYVPAGGGRTIRIDSRGAGQMGGGGTARGAVSWRDVASLSCDGSPACVRELVDRGTVVFEVRRRRGGSRRARAVLLGRVLGSELVGRAEVPWRNAGGSDDHVVAVPVERRVELAAPSSRRALGEEAPAFLTARMSVRVSETTPVPAGRRRLDSPAHPPWQSGGEWSVGDEDVFAAVACAADAAFE